MTEYPLIPSILYTRSSEELQKAVAEELQTPDPKDGSTKSDQKDSKTPRWTHPGC